MDAKDISQKNTPENFTERKPASYFISSESKNKLLQANPRIFLFILRNKNYGIFLYLT